MDRIVAVNDYLKHEITKLDYNMVLPHFQGDARAVKAAQDSLSRVIDQLGLESANAQNLSKIITSAEKLARQPGHWLYIYKDSNENGGHGGVVGLLKVGRKHLYLYDEEKKVHEVDPVCVLDTYISAHRQRQGIGRQLFDYMLKDVDAKPDMLAIDGPSYKLEEFLKKNYGIPRLLRQSNNFAVSPTFFGTLNNSCGGPYNHSPPTRPAGRFTAKCPPSSIASVIHGSSDSNFSRSNGKS